MNHAEVDRSALEHQATVLRTRLGATLEELDRRRHEAFDLRLQARRHHLPRLLLLTAGAAGAALLLGGAAWTVARIARQRRAARLRSRLRLLGVIVRHPERLLRPPRPASTSTWGDRLGHLGRSALVGVLTSLASTALRLAFSQQAPAEITPPAAPAPQAGAVR